MVTSHFLNMFSSVHLGPKPLALYAIMSRASWSCAARLRPRRFAIVLFRFLSLTASGACLIVALQVAGWPTVFLAPGWSMARRAVGFLSARGPPARDALAASVANAPRFARNALRP